MPSRTSILMSRVLICLSLFLLIQHCGRRKPSIEVEPTKPVTSRKRPKKPSRRQWTTWREVLSTTSSWVSTLKRLRAIVWSEFSVFWVHASFCILSPVDFAIISQIHIHSSRCRWSVSYLFLCSQCQWRRHLRRRRNLSSLASIRLGAIAWKSQWRSRQSLGLLSWNAKCLFRHLVKSIKNGDVCVWIGKNSLGFFVGMGTDEDCEGRAYNYDSSNCIEDKNSKYHSHSIM